MHHASEKAHASCCQRTAPHPRRLAASHGLGAAAYTDALICLPFSLPLPFLLSPYFLLSLCCLTNTLW